MPNLKLLAEMPPFVPVLWKRY